jgi:hypothetical protein
VHGILVALAKDAWKEANPNKRLPANFDAGI